MLSTSFFLFSCADDQARAQIADTNVRLDKLQGNVGIIDNKISDQKMIDILNKLDSLQSQIDELNGKISTISHDQKTFESTQDQLYQSLEQQIQALDPTNNQNESTADVSPKKSSSAPAVVASGGNELKSALKKIKSRNFPQAIKDLKNIISTSQDAGTIQNASYYLTITYAANNQFSDAIITGQKYAKEYPDSQNAPDALRTVYISQQQLGMKKSAAKTSVLIKEKYPNSDAAKKIAASN